MSASDAIVAGAVGERFPVGCVVRIGRGITRWQVQGVDADWIHLTCTSITGAPQRKALLNPEALARLTRVAS